MSLVEQLLEMGFTRLKAEKAIEETGNTGIEDAINWMMTHEDYTETNDDTGDSAKMTDSPKDPTNDQDSENVEANSYKCDDCGKLFKSDGKELELHAERTGHSNFSESVEEIKPLTEEDKRVKAIELQDKIKMRRGERIEKEKTDELKKEKSRRTTGKKVSSMKAELAEQEMMKIAEERKRDKEADRVARQKVKDEIERDRKDRAAKFSKASSSETTPSTQVITSPIANTQSCDKCRIQFRLTDGSTMVQQFGSKEPLAAVRLFVQMNRTDGGGPSFILKTTFPTKTFTEDDMEKSLLLLGLVPSATVLVCKC